MSACRTSGSSTSSNGTAISNPHNRMSGELRINPTRSKDLFSSPDPFSPTRIPRISSTNSSLGSGTASSSRGRPSLSIATADSADGPGIRRTKSMLSLRRSMQLSDPTIDVAEVRKKPTRLKKLRHIVGFRKLNRRIVLCEQVVKVCNTIDFIMERQLTSVQLTIEQIEEVLPKLQRTQSTLYHLSDKIVEFDEVLQEVQYMKANLEECVRNSVCMMQQHNAQHGFELVGNGWSDSNEFQHLMQVLTSTITNSWEESNAASPISRPRVQVVVQRARDHVAEIQRKPHCHAILDARPDLELLQDEMLELQLIEHSMHQAVMNHNVVTGVLLALCREIRATEKYLKVQIDRLSGQLSSRPSKSQVLDEKELLMDLIKNARTYERQTAAMEAKILETSTAEAGNFARKLSHTGRTAPASPIWAQSWAQHTKLLKKRTD